MDFKALQEQYAAGETRLLPPDKLAWAEETITKFKELYNDINRNFAAIAQVLVMRGGD